MKSSLESDVSSHATDMNYGTCSVSDCSGSLGWSFIAVVGCLFQVVRPPGVAAGRGARAAALRSPRLEQEVSLCCKPFLLYS